MYKRDIKKRGLLVQERVKALCGKWGLPIPSRSQTIGAYGELLAFNHYKQQGKDVVKTSFNGTGDYDLLIDGEKVEVKTSYQSIKNTYNFTLRANFREGIPLFDKLCLVFLPNMEEEPYFMEVSSQNLPSMTGLGGDFAYFQRLM